MKLRAMFAGVVGAVLMAIVSAIARAFGVPMDLEWLQGSFVLGPNAAHTTAAYVVGLSMQLGLGAILGLVYAAILVRTERHSLLTGAVLGTFHALIAGAVLAWMTPFHPAVPEAISAPGVLMIRRGQDAAIVFTAMHTGFGMLMSKLAVSRRQVVERARHA